MKLSEVVSLVLFVGLCLGVGWLSSFSTRGGLDPWYQQLERPPGVPPDWTFGVVWTTLYILMGIAAWLVFQRGWSDPRVRIALSLFVVQLILNGIWSPLFFGAHLLGVALADLIILWAVLLATTILFWPISLPAGLLLLPYLGWVTYAGYLNGGFWLLNR